MDWYSLRKKLYKKHHDTMVLPRPHMKIMKSGHFLSIFGDQGANLHKSAAFLQETHGLGDVVIVAETVQHHLSSGEWKKKVEKF